MSISLGFLLFAITLLCTAAWRAVDERADGGRNPNTDDLFVLGMVSFLVSLGAMLV